MSIFKYPPPLSIGTWLDDWINQLVHPEGHLHPKIEVQFIDGTPLEEMPQ